MCDTCKHSRDAKNSGDKPNKFQSLIESPQVQLYTSDGRHKKTVVIEEGHFDSSILPAIKSAAEAHVSSRADAIKKRIDHAT